MKLPQLSLREMFWLVLVAACIIGWQVDHWRLSHQLEVFESQNRSLIENLQAEQVRTTGNTFVFQNERWPIKPGETVEITLEEDGKYAVRINK
jgi:hypothetical protein